MAATPRLAAFQAICLGIEIRGAIAELVYVLSQYQNDVIDVGEFKKCLGDYNQSGEIFLNRIVHLAFDKGYSYLK